MTELPILFKGEMVRAILDGRKTMTRRVVKLPLIDRNGTGCEIAGCEAGSMLRQGRYDLCPFGAPGDHLWVRETWANIAHAGYDPVIFYRADEDDSAVKWKPSIFMPRWASRITLEITEVRVQRVQEIHRRDAQAEGVLCRHCKGYTDNTTGCTCVSEFQKLWDSCGYNWAANPWTWAISFKRIKP